MGDLLPMRKQAEQIPASALTAWGEFVSDSSMGLTERIFARSFRVSVEAGLRWDDLLSTAPATTVLMKEGLIGCAAKTKTRGMPDGRPLGGATDFSFLTETGPHMGFSYSKKTRVDSPAISG